MGRASRNNPVAQDAKAGLIKPLAHSTLSEGDRLRTHPSRVAVDVLGGLAGFPTRMELVKRIRQKEQEAKRKYDEDHCTIEKVEEGSDVGKD
jgi:hypothetical protein